MHLIRLAVLLCAVASAEVLSAQARVLSVPCDTARLESPASPADTVFDGCSVSAPVRLRTAARPSFAFRAQHPCAVAELEFVVGANGRPRPATARVLRTNVDAFGEQVRRSAGRWRFEPASRNGFAVAQLVRVRYALSDETSGRTPPPVVDGSRRLLEPTVACPAS